MERREYVMATRMAQGLPALVEDPAVLVKIAATLTKNQHLRDSERPIEQRTPMPTRPARRMPRLRDIAIWHRLGPHPSCVRCGWASWKETWDEKGTGLERAHIIDRSIDNGLDHEGNLAPLCKRCHATQPIFKPGQEAEALAWFKLASADA